MIKKIWRTGSFVILINQPEIRLKYSRAFQDPRFTSPDAGPASIASANEGITVDQHCLI